MASKKLTAEALAKATEKAKELKALSGDIEKQIAGKSPLEQSRILAMANLKKKWDRPDAVITAAHLDDGLTFIQIPDLMYQWALQRPGYAMGKIQSLIGFEGASKTSKQLWLANLAMRQGGLAAGVFVEHADSTTHMKNYLAPEFMDYFPCYIAETLEEAIEMTYDIQRNWELMDEGWVKHQKMLKDKLKGRPSADERENILAELAGVELQIKDTPPRVQIFDSIAGATQEKLLKDDSEPGAPKPGGIGGIMADFVNAMKTRIRRTKSLWAVNNQAREDIPIGFAAMLPKAEIEKLVAKGGKAIPFHASYFEVIKKGAANKDGDKTIEGFGVTLTFKKNKYGVPLRKLTYDVVWGRGLVFTDSTMETLVINAICGLESKKSESRGGGKVYWSKQLGIKEGSALSEEEMYDLIHTPEFMPRFQEALKIVTDVTAMAPVSGDEAMDEDLEKAASLNGPKALTETPPPPPPPDEA